MPESPVSLLSQLIAIPSVNPLLAADCDREPGERQLTEWLCRWCDQRGWRRLRQQVHPGRANVVALVPGDSDETLLWDVHQDTVSTAGMTVDPFAARSEAGRLFGRGACDVKGAMAAMLCAAESAGRMRSAGRPNLLLAFTVNEECGFTGAASLAELWGREAASQQVAPTNVSGALTLDEVRALRPSRAIVAEPTGLDVVVAHRGVVRWRCRTVGRSAHSSQPQTGLNAITAMAEVVRAVDRFHRDVLANRIDPLCGASTAVVTTIRGGTGPNTVPDETVIDIDRRLTTTETPTEACRELMDDIARRVDLHGCQVTHDPPWMQSRGLSDAENRDWAHAVAQVARATGGAAETVGVPYGTNAATIAAAGIPTVVLGPGSIDQAHTADEWIAIDQLEQATEILSRIACGDASRANA